MPHLFVFKQFRMQNRFPLLLELLQPIRTGGKSFVKD